MGNCLVTRLKGVVNNSNLDYFNTINLYCRGNRELHDGITIYSDAPLQCTAKIVSGNGSFSDTEDNVVETPFGVIVATEGYGYRGGTGVRSLDGNPVKVIIENAYITNKTGIGGGIVTDYNRLFTYMSGIKHININGEGNYNVFGKLKSLSDIPTTVEHLIFHNTVKLEEAGNVSEFARLTNAKGISFANESKISGNINTLGSLTGLTELNLANTSVSGTVEEFAAAQVAAGRTSGRMLFRVYGDNVSVTYGGQKNISYWSAIDFDSSLPNGYKFIPDTRNA